MLKDTKAIHERIDYLYKNYYGTPQQQKLHPIDQMLLFANKEISSGWYSILAKIGINYTTPCRWIRTNNEWFKYCDDCYPTILMVSSAAYSLVSDHDQLSKYGKLATEEDFRKDKQHQKCGRLVFDHHITKKEYYDIVWEQKI